MDKTTAIAAANHNESLNSISFLGGFCVRNREGKDISSQFSPILRKVLAALIVYSEGDKQGVLGEKIDSLIWGYKPEGTATNNRNVYLSRLRKALEEVDGVCVTTRNQLTSISLSPQVTCDYLELLRLYRTEATLVDADKLLSLLYKGDPFANMNDEWLNEFRQEFSVMTVAFLSQLLSHDNLSPATHLKISETIIRYDRLNEPALKARCRLHHQQGNLSFAKEIYEQYRRDHKEFIGEEYSQSFKDVLSM